MLLVSLMLAQVLNAVGAQRPLDNLSDAAQAAEPIVVIGRSLRASEVALEQCLARRCPPAKDIAAAVAHAENQLIAGELKAARDTLLKARGRNKRFAAALPEAVSGLLYLNAEVASLLGFKEAARIGTSESVSALKRGLPVGDPRIAAQRLLVADVFRRQGRFSVATDMYDAVAEQAEAAGWPRVQAAAMFRALTFYATAASVDPAYRADARRRYAALRRTSHPAMQPIRDASFILEARLALLVDEKADVAPVLNQIVNKRTAAPMLVYAPTIDLTSLLTPSSWDNPEEIVDQWADVSFRITRDGRVADVTMGAQGSRTNGRWVDLAKTALLGRRYLPLDLPPDAPGVWKRERFLLVADRQSRTRSRIRTQSAFPKLRTLDLTATK